MNGISIIHSWVDPEGRPFEIAERKGLGHPDTVADGIADAVSNEFSRHCLKNFGAVLHHNVDKVYVGAGHWTVDYGRADMHAPVRVVINGRMSSSLGDKHIDIRAIQEKAARQYLALVLPKLEPNDVIVISSATQYTQRAYWYTPRGLDDLPDATHPKANDTSLCVAHAPFTMTERLAFELERFFWITDEGATGPYSLKPRYRGVGQDIKVMALRRGDHINITACVPFLCKHISSFEMYRDGVLWIERLLQAEADRITADTRFKAHIEVNRTEKDHRVYLLAIGSCVECGEEGIVGRGNPIGGVIAAGRAHSVEAPYGKNPVYHSGKVLGFLTQKLACAIFKELGIPSSVYALTVNSQSLIPPHTLIVETPARIDLKSLYQFIEQNMFSIDYVNAIIKAPLTLRPFAGMERPKQKGST